MSHRLPALLLLVLLALVPAACGSDDASDTSAPSAETATVEEPPIRAEDEREDLSDVGAPYRLNQVEQLLERAGLRLVRTGLEPDNPGDQASSINALAAVREEVADTGQEFDLYVFGSEQEAIEGIRELRDSEVLTEDGVLVRGENVVAVLPSEPAGDPALQVVQDVLRDLPPNPAEGVSGRD